MQSIPTIDERADSIAAELRRLTSAPPPLQPDLRGLWHALHEQGPIDRRQAAEIFHANRLTRADRHGWIEFYLSALTGFFLVFQDDRFALSERSAAMLLRWLGDETPITNIGERRLTLRILLRAARVPERFERRILDAISWNLLHEDERWSSRGRRSAGVIDALDLHLIRNLVSGAGAQAADGASCAKVRLVLDLDQKADHIVDPQAWRRLLTDLSGTASLLRR